MPCLSWGGAEVGRLSGMVPLFQGVKGGFEEEVSPAPVFIAGPVLVIVVAGQQEAFRVGHQAHGAAGGILEARDAAFTAVAVVHVLESHISGSQVFFRVSGAGDQAAFRVGGGQLEFIRKALEEG